jgi:hypothetical protein
LEGDRHVNSLSRQPRLPRKRNVRVRPAVRRVFFLFPSYFLIL